jgi:hypothetical protein
MIKATLFVDSEDWMTRFTAFGPFSVLVVAVRGHSLVS